MPHPCKPKRGVEGPHFISLIRLTARGASPRFPTTGEGERNTTRRVNIGAMAEEPRTTVFGTVVGELMLGRDIRSWTDLGRLLEAHGHDFEASRLS